MKIASVMNFVRQIDQRYENSDFMFEKTHEELLLVNELNVKNTFLLQYDTMCNEKYVDMFKNETTENTELGIWYEIVRPLSEKCGIEYKSRHGWDWDWNITPGFPMAYTPDERERMADEAMRKFREVFGYYPKTFASWVIDTHTANYITANYDIDTLAICRDQVNTDAYTLIGGYFNGAYYPSKNNIFTPAQNKDMQNKTPVFRLLGPCPFHNYDNKKYCSDELAEHDTVYTLEPYAYYGSNKKNIDGMLDSYYINESLSIAFAQLGQENGFGPDMQVIKPLKYQIEKIKSMKNTELLTMGECGRRFKKEFPDETPASCVTALKNPDSADIQSVCYSCKNYTANIFRYEKSVFIRYLYLFDERITDKYLKEKCETFDAVYQNLPVADTLVWENDSLTDCGIVIDSEAQPFDVQKISDSKLKVYWNGKSVILDENEISITAEKLMFYFPDAKADITVNGNRIEYKTGNADYAVEFSEAKIRKINKDTIEITIDGSTQMSFIRK